MDEQTSEGAGGGFPTFYRHRDGVAVGRLGSGGALEIPLFRGWIRLGWITPDGSVYNELASERYGWVVNGVGYRTTHPDDPIVLVTESGIIRDGHGDVAGNVDPPDALAGAALFVALSS
jgi:hypothetical protein